MANKKSIFLKRILAFTLAVFMLLGAFLDYGISFASEKVPVQEVATYASRLDEVSPEEPVPPTEPEKPGPKPEKPEPKPIVVDERLEQVTLV